jgi:hypothetical protein
MSSDDYKDPRVEAQWFAKQRSVVERCLEGQGL